MSIFEIRGGRVTHQYLMNKPKSEIAHLYMELLGCFEKAQKRVSELEIKNSGTLANNLCPDHRDKQTGKPCLACKIEELQAQIKRIKNLPRYDCISAKDVGIIPWPVMYVDANELEAVIKKEGDRE